jgi:hypothetical protein
MIFREKQEFLRISTINLRKKLIFIIKKKLLKNTKF